MTVANLQQHLADLAKLLEASGAKTVARDLAAIGQALSPFQSHGLQDFATFLGQADTYVRTGVLPAPGKGGRKATTPRKPAEPKPDAAALAGQAAVLYERAADPIITPGDVDELMSRVDKLTGPGLKTVAQAIGLKVPAGKKVPEIKQMIRHRIEERMGTRMRGEMIHRPSVSDGHPSTSFAGSIGG